MVMSAIIALTAFYKLQITPWLQTQTGKNRLKQSLMMYQFCSVVCFYLGLTIPRMSFNCQSAIIQITHTTYQTAHQPRVAAAPGNYPAAACLQSESKLHQPQCRIVHRM